MDAKGNTTTFTYDATGQLTQQVEPVSATSSITTSFGYDAGGNRTRVTDGRFHTWIYTYNSHELLDTELDPITGAYQDQMNQLHTYGYDVANRLVKQTLPGGVTLNSTYDAAGELTKQTGSGAEVPTADRTFGYDGDGRIMSATTAVGTAGTAGYQPATSETFTSPRAR